MGGGQISPEKLISDGSQFAWRQTAIVRLSILTPRAVRKRILLREAARDTAKFRKKQTHCGTSRSAFLEWYILFGAGNRELIVMSITGQVLRSITFSEDSHTLDISDLEPGLYMVTVRSAHSIASEIVLKK